MDTITTTKIDLTQYEETAKIAKAIAHPVRLSILNLLISSACCFHGDMAEVLPIAKSTLSQHLAELKNAGLIQGNITPPNIKYCILVMIYHARRNIIRRRPLNQHPTTQYIYSLRPQIFTSTKLTP
jgi:predicted transcriptional regulator